MSNKAISLFITSFYLLLISIGILLINYIPTGGNSATPVHILFHCLGVILFFIGVCVGIGGFLVNCKEDKE